MLTGVCQSRKLWLSARAAVKPGLSYDCLRSQHVRYAPAACFLAVQRGRTVSKAACFQAELASTSLTRALQFNSIKRSLSNWIYLPLCLALTLPSWNSMCLIKEMRWSNLRVFRIFGAGVKKDVNLLNANLHLCQLIPKRFGLSFLFPIWIQ